MTNQFTNKMQNQVKEFHESFGHPINDKPTLVDIKRFTNRQIWACEENLELIHALSNNDEEFKEYFKVLMEGLRDAYHKQLDKKRPINEKDKIVAVADAIADALYFKFGDAVEAGVDIELVMNHVQNSNMSKLFEDEDGNLYAEYREDGKILKSERFFEPEPKIKEEIENQIKGIKPKSFSDFIKEQEVPLGGYIDDNLESKDLIPKEVMIHDGEVLLDKETAKKLNDNVEKYAHSVLSVEMPINDTTSHVILSGEVLNENINNTPTFEIDAENGNVNIKGNIKKSVKKVKTEQVKEVIESAIESKNDDSNK